MNFPHLIKSNSVEETEAAGLVLADFIASDAQAPRFIALYGDLGVGKTAFTRGFTSRFAKQARVKSPTFALVNEYKGESLTVFHFDMYRITDEDELYSIGFYDYLNRNGIALVEWSENIEYALPSEYFSVKIEKSLQQSEDYRKITLELIKKS